MRYGTIAVGLITAAALVIGTSANAQIASKGGGYLFRQKFTSGQTLNYLMDANTSAPGVSVGGGTFKMQMTIRMNVISVSNGIATVKISSDGMTLNGKNSGRSESQVVKIDSRGQMTGNERGGGVSPIFPQGPIKIGDIFSSETGGMTAMGGFNTKSTFRLVGFKMFNGHKVAQLALNANAAGKVGGTASGFVLISEADGQVVSGRTDSIMKVGQNGKTLTVNSHIKVDRK